MNVFLDIEASGLGPESYPIEIALVSDSFQFSSLIKPDIGWDHWDKGAESVHGICRSALLRGRDRGDIWSILLHIGVRRVSLWSDAPLTDSFWLAKLGFNDLVVNDITLLEGYRKNPAPPHRALGDAMYNYNLFKKINGL